MTFTFVKALGGKIGILFVKMTNRSWLWNFKIGQRKGVQIHIPVDVIAADSFRIQPIHKP
jgi:phosphoglycerate kinase